MNWIGSTIIIFTVSKYPRSTRKENGVPYFRYSRSLFPMVNDDVLWPGIRIGKATVIFIVKGSRLGLVTS